MPDDYVLGRTAEWVRQQRGVGAGDPPLSVARLLTLVRVPDVVALCDTRDARPVRVYSWYRLPPGVGYDFRVSLAVERASGTLLSFGEPRSISGADLDYVHRRFANPEWRCAMGLEPDAAARLIDEVDHAYRERQRQRARQAAEIAGLWGKKGKGIHVLYCEYHEATEWRALSECADGK